MKAVKPIRDNKVIKNMRSIINTMQSYDVLFVFIAKKINLGKIILDIQK